MTFSSEKRLIYSTNHHCVKYVHTCKKKYRLLQLTFTWHSLVTYSRARKFCGYLPIPKKFTHSKKINTGELYCTNHHCVKYVHTCKKKYRLLQLTFTWHSLVTYSRARKFCGYLPIPKKLIPANFTL